MCRKLLRTLRPEIIFCVLSSIKMYFRIFQRFPSTVQWRGFEGWSFFFESRVLTSFFESLRLLFASSLLIFISKLLESLKSVSSFTWSSNNRLLGISLIPLLFNTIFINTIIQYHHNSYIYKDSHDLVLRIELVYNIIF